MKYTKEYVIENQIIVQSNNAEEWITVSNLLGATNKATSKFWENNCVNSFSKPRKERADCLYRDSVGNIGFCSRKYFENLNKLIITADRFIMDNMDYIDNQEKGTMFVYRTEQGITKYYNTKDIIWHTAFSGKITINKMDNNHLKNTIRCIERRKERGDIYDGEGDIELILYALKIELTNRETTANEETTTKKETKIMQHKDIELKSDLTKTLTQNIAIEEAYIEMQEIELEAKRNIEINRSYQVKKDNIDEKMEEISKANKELDKRYNKQKDIIEANTKKPKTKK